MQWRYAKKVRGYAHLMRLDKPIGIFLLLWPTLMALWIAGNGRPDSIVVIVFVAGVVLMRSAGCVINDFADRGFDKAVKRTEHRPIVAGRVKSTEALSVFLFLLLLAFILVLQLNTLTIGMSVVGLLLASAYPYMKRYTHWPQVVLGAAFGWGVPMAYVALTRKIAPEAFLLYFANLSWVIAYDTEYAMVDREEDIPIGVKSTAILFGRLDRFWIGILQLMSLALFMELGLVLGMGKWYFFGLMAAALSAGYQQYLIKDRIPEYCFRAFLNNNLFGALLFGGLWLHYQTAL